MLIDFAPRETCGPDCETWLSKWAVWYSQRLADRKPLAMLRCSPDYYPQLSRKSRAMVRNAQRDYTYRVFDHNSRLDEMTAVNFSKPVRQGRKMGSWYTKPVTAHESPALCPAHRDEWHGCFTRDDDVLVGFARLEVFDDVGILNSILGHGDYIGVMNGMFQHLNDHADVRLINYLRIHSATDQLGAFKRRVGFRPWDPKREDFV